MYIVDRNTMTAAEKLADQRGTDYLTLMFNAGTAASDYIKQNAAVKNSKVAILCGKGNNGGDGFVIASQLSQGGAAVSVILTHGEPTRQPAKSAYEKIPSDVLVLDLDQGQKRLENREYDLVIDAVFGTGYNNSTSEKEIENLFKSVGISDFAIDMPSLLDCDTGRGSECALPTKCTITFAAKKKCHVLPYSADVCGDVVCLDIGISNEILKEAGANITEIEKPIITCRKKTSFKNNYGVALSVCGSYGMPGAAIISAKAALRSGVGILKLATIKENCTACAVSLPEAVLIPVNSRDGTFSPKAVPSIKKELKKASALLIGCGLGLNRHTKKIVKELLLTTDVPTVLDADGINAVAQDIELLRKVKAPLVITPHPGEMARLCGISTVDVEKDRFEIARRFSTEFGVYTVLKGANTIVAEPSGEMFVNVIGNPGMATAGSGDMLAGIMVSLLANGENVCQAVKKAVWLHSAAGDSAREILGDKAMLPTDMIEELYKFLK